MHLLYENAKLRFRRNGCIALDALPFPCEVQAAVRVTEHGEGGISTSNPSEAPNH